MFKIFTAEIGQGRAVHAKLFGSDRASAAGITAHAYTPVLELCRLLVAAGFDPDRPLAAYRGATLALHIRSIGTAAKLELNSKGTAFVRCRQAVRRTPPIEPRTAKHPAEAAP
jgi:hypothetical protein